MKINPAGAGLFHADGWTDGQTDRPGEANIRFRNFANEPIRVKVKVHRNRPEGPEGVEV
jgi:hypothetical protein